MIINKRKQYVFENKPFMDLEYDEDPMKNMEGEDGEKMLELLTQHSQKNDLKILKNAKFEEDSVSFQLEIKFSEDLV